MSTSEAGRVSCPSCGRAYKWQASLGGKKVRCKCEKVIVMPATEPAPGAEVKAKLHVAAPQAAPAAAKAPTKPVAPPATPKTAPAAPPVSEDLGLNLNDDELKLSLDEPAAAPAVKTSKLTAPPSNVSAAEDGGYELNLDEPATMKPAPPPPPSPAAKAAAPAAPKPATRPAPAPAKTAAKTAKPAEADSLVLASVETPAPEAAVPPSGGAACPSCGKAVKPGAVICIACGFNILSGKKLDTVSGVASNALGHARRVRTGPPEGIFARFARGWEFAKISYGILWDFKQLIVFPICSGIAAILVFASFLIPLFSTGMIDKWAQLEKEGKHDPVAYVVTFLFYFCTYFIIVFFNTGLTACAMKVTAGEVPTLKYGFSVAIKRLPQIAAWALLSAVIGLLLKMIENSNKKLGKFIASVIGSAWTVITYFIVPVLVVEGVGPFKALKRSFETLTTTWGEGLIGNSAMGLISFLMFLPVVILCGVGAFLMIAAQNTVGFMVVVCVFVTCWILHMAASSAADGVFRALLYNYATGRELPGDIDESTFAGAFADRQDSQLG